MAGHKPTYNVFYVKDVATGEGKEKGIWTKIGVAWTHQDGKGFDIKLDLIPYEPRIKLREYDENAK